MSNRSLNLHLFSFGNDDDEIVQALIDAWHSLDTDYDEGSDNWRVDDDLEELGFNTQAEKEVKQLDITEYDDVSFIGAVMDMISDGHGSYSSQFTYEIEEQEEGYCVAVAYLT